MVSNNFNHNGKAPMNSGRLAPPGMNMDGASDRSPGPPRSASSPGSQRTGSQQGGPQHGRSPSGSGPAPPQAVRPGYPPPLGHDPARFESKAKLKFLAPLTPTERVTKRCELPADAYDDPLKNHTPFAKRPGYSTTGGNINVSVNQFRVTKLGNGDINQYDVSISPDPEHGAVWQKVWDSKAVKQKMKEANKVGPWLYDGRKLAWTNSAIDEIRVLVDLDAEQGKPTRDSHPNKWFFTLKPTGKIRLAALRGYLEGKSSWDNSVLECMSFLDHVLRQGPSERMKLIKRVFVNEYSENSRLNTVTEAIKGIYSTIRLNDTIKTGGYGLGVNVDVSNQTFWVGQKFEQLVRNYLNSINKSWCASYDAMARDLKPIQKGPNEWVQSEAFKALRKLYNVRFEVTHRAKTPGNKEYKVKKFSFDKAKGPMTARTIKFKKMFDGVEKEVTILEYYMRQYGARLQYPDFPLVETTRAGYFPFECCDVKRLNPYPFKLDPAQTQAMIKFAVQRPPARKEQITKMVQNLNWGQDRYLKAFGIEINPTMATIPAKLLKNPKIQFGGKQLDPGTSGRWDLRGQRFLASNKEPLASWSFATIGDAVDGNTLANFAKVFMTTYKGHGGKIANDPMLIRGPSGDVANAIESIYHQTGNKFHKIPQIIFLIVKEKSTQLYERIKKNTDCRFAFVSQVLNFQHVQKAQGQYCSNVCMKVNAKLGGQTCGLPEKYFKAPTMIIGADVSHGGIGTDQASLAAICSSVDKDAITYRTAVQTNGHRVEMITPSNIESMLPEMIKGYAQANGGKGPEHLFYIRDGVSEGQFAHVLEQEVEIFKRIFMNTVQKVPKMTVIIATKRHHIRFFPERGDRNGNALPGTLVEKEVTHPFHYDFYLCSHVAIQGTARPVHYNVIRDEIGYPPDQLQKMIYHHCYQYCRSTTPISLHPAVYYAHLASNRARAHENTTPVNQNQGKAENKGVMAKHDASTNTSTNKEIEVQPLVPMGATSQAKPGAGDKMRATMWWV